MFKLARKVKQLTQSKVTISQNIVAEIHKEFDQATDKLLIEANEVLNIKMDVSRADRLKNIGFVSMKEVEDAALLSRQRKSKEILANLIRHYTQFYPHNKFITEDVVEQICKKYGLVFGLAMYYKGDMPEKNLKEIESFKLREEEKEYHSCGPCEDHQQIWGYYDGLDRRMGNNYRGNWISVPDKARFVRVQPAFKICASKDDFDMSNMQVRDSYKLEHVPDPVVLQPVEGGYLIVSKWGLEASDESLVNEKMN